MFNPLINCRFPIPNFGSAAASRLPRGSRDFCTTCPLERAQQQFRRAREGSDRLTFGSLTPPKLLEGPFSGGSCCSRPNDSAQSRKRDSFFPFRRRGARCLSEMETSTSLVEASTSSLGAQLGQSLLTDASVEPVRGSTAQLSGTPPPTKTVGVQSKHVASPQVRVPCAASGHGTVAVNSPATKGVTSHLHTAPTDSKKRKRPPALSITNDMLTHGAGAKLRLATERDLLDAGAAEETVVVEGDTFALSSKRGKRRMSYEDAYVAAPGLDGDPTQGIFSVFDGHGGREAADFASEHLHNEVLKAVRDACAGIPEDEDEAAVDVVKVAMVQGFLATDRRFLAEGHLRGGATATTAFLRRGRIWVANVGDCRAVMCEGGTAKALTHDHRPDKEEEREAVERRGGEVVKILGTSRVQGVLGVSRSIGDRDLKQYITAEPEVFSMLVSNQSEFLILGTDGLWDVVGNQEATDLVAAKVDSVSGGRRGIDAASRGLVELARTRGSRDDISVLIVELELYRSGATPASSPDEKHSS